MPRLTVVTPLEPTAPAAAPVVPEAARDGGTARATAYAAAMQARCALARLIHQAGHREPPRHRAA